MTFARTGHQTKMSLRGCNREEREEYMEHLRRLCVEHREPHEPRWIELFEEWRNIADWNSPYRNKVRSTYAFTAVLSQIALIEPLFFASDPVCDIASKWEEDHGDNRAHEQLLTKQIHSFNFRKAWASATMEAAVFGASFPTFNFTQRMRRVGPFPSTHGDGPPLFGPDGSVLASGEYRNLQVWKGPEMQSNSLWNTYIAPDGIRGMVLKDMTGYELVELSEGPHAIFDSQRVQRALRIAKREVEGGPSKSRDDMNFSFGDDSQVVRDQLAQLLDTDSGLRAEWEDVDTSLRKNVMHFPFPVYFYDDGEFSGAYLLNKDGRMYELRFFEACSIDGTPNRVPLYWTVGPGQDTYPPGLLEIAHGLLKSRTRTLQLAMDGMELTVHPQWMVSDTYDRLNGEVMAGPGAINVVPSLGGKLEEHIKRMDLPQSWANAMNARGMVIDPELDDMFAMDDHTRGQFPSGRHTAAEANLVGMANSARVELVGSRIDAFFARPALRKMDLMNRAYMTSEDYRDALGDIGSQGVNMERDFEEVLKRNEYIFKGSVLTSTKNQMLMRYPQLVGQYLAALPMMQLPHVQELFKRWFQDAGMEAITRAFPPADGTIPTMFNQASQGGGAMFPERPASPTDAMGALMAAEGGAGAPPPPSNPAGPLAAGTGMSSESKQQLTNLM